MAFSPSPKYFVTHAYAAAKRRSLVLVNLLQPTMPRGHPGKCDRPGLVETPMAQRAANDDAILSFIKTKQPLDGGSGQASDLDGLAVYL